MGTSFAGLHIRSSNPETVFTAFRSASDLPLLISRTPVSGMVSVYPDSLSSEQLRAITKEVTRSLATAGLVFEVRDSNSVEILLFNKGVLVSHFANEHEGRPRSPGKPSVMARHARREESEVDLALRTGSVLAEQIATAVGRLFGIPDERIVCDFGHFRSAQAPEWLLRK